MTDDAIEQPRRTPTQMGRPAEIIRFARHDAVNFGTPDSSREHLAVTRTSLLF